MSGEARPDLSRASLGIIEAGQDTSGAFVACPTFPAYRFAWIRDGSFVAEALDLWGRTAAASRFHEWMTGIVLGARDGMERSIRAAQRGERPAAGDHLECRYTPDGRPGPPGWETFQLDGPGIWLWSVAHHAACGGQPSARVREAAAHVARYLAALWPLPCADAWEEWPDRVHASTLVAILAGLRALPALGIDPASVEGARTATDAIATRLLAGRGPITKWDGSEAVDASLLWLVAPFGVAEADHPRVAATLGRIEAELVEPDGGVHRYRGDTYYGGGEWLLLAAARGRALLRRGRPGDRERAWAALDWVAGQADRRGWMPEQVTAHPLARDRVDEWRARWGEVASPLLWSHAAYLALASELGVTPD